MAIGWLDIGIALFSGVVETQSATTAASTVTGILIATGTLTADMKVSAGNPLCPITC
jgi:hypothetical protein